MNRRKFVRLAIGTAVAALLLGLLLQTAGLTALWDTLRGVDLSWVALATGALLIAYAARIARWQAMLVMANPRLTFRNCAEPFLISVAANNTLPFRAGDALRCLAFQKTLGVHTGTVIASLLVERLLDLLILVALLALALIAFGLGVPGLDAYGPWILAGVAVMLFAALVKPTLIEPLLRTIIRPLATLWPRGHAESARILTKTIATFERLMHRRRFPAIALWSLAVWTFEGIAFLCVAYAVPGLSAAVAALLALPMATLATLIPGTPAHIGTFDYFAATAMTTVGQDPASAAAFAILIHMIIVIPPTLLGAAFSLRLPLMAAPRLGHASV